MEMIHMFKQHEGHSRVRDFSTLNKHRVSTAHPDPKLADDTVVFFGSNAGPCMRRAGFSKGVHTGKVAGAEVITDPGFDLADFVNDPGSGCSSQDEGVTPKIFVIVDMCDDCVQPAQTDLSLSDISAIGAASSCAKYILFGDRCGAFASIVDSSFADPRFAQHDLLAATIELPPVVADAGLAEVIADSFPADQQFRQHDFLAATIESPPVAADFAGLTEVIDCCLFTHLGRGVAGPQIQRRHGSSGSSGFGSELGGGTFAAIGPVGAGCL